MKQIPLQDIKPSTLYWRQAGESLVLIKTWSRQATTLGKYLGYSVLCGEEKEEGNIAPEDALFEVLKPVPGSIEVLKKDYDGESIVDLGRDISECVIDDYNPIVNQIPEMEHGFWAGTFKVSVIWEPDSE